MSGPSYLFVLPWDPQHVGGVSGVVKSLAATMAERGAARPLIFANSWQAKSPRHADHCTLFRLSLFASTSVAGVLKACILAPAQLWRILRLLRAIDARVVNFHYPGLAPVGVAILKRIGAFDGKIVLSYHGSDVAAPSGPIERALLAFVHRSADHIVACSRSLAGRMAHEFGIAPARISVIYNGVDPMLFNGTADARFPIELPGSFIVSISSFIPRKNLLLLLRAFALLARRFPDLHLCIAGGDGPERARVGAEARSSGLGDRVHLLVDLDQAQVATLLARARACVQTSLAESFPLAVIEAGASGTPLVVSDIPGHDELVRDGVTGRTFPPGDPEACARAIAAVLDDPPVAARMAAAQRHWVRDTLTWSATMSQYERLVEAL